jgi:protein-tyrosine-phosphatase
MAEYYFNFIANKKTAESCGLFANPGSSMSVNSRKVLEAENIIAGAFASRQIDEDMIKKFDVIYGITASHEARLKENFPKYTGKIKSMPEDIGDPYGGSLEDYAACFEKIKKSVDVIKKSLIL